MKLILLTVVCAVVLVGSIAAQSGRRIKTVAATPSTETAPKPVADSVTAAGDGTVGYSESAPSSPITLSPRRNRESKKEEKKSSENKSAPTATDPKPADPDEADVIKVETNLVTIPVSVSDRDGFYVPSLGEQNFKIFEDGIEQKIEYFGTSDKPFTVVLLIDVSPSTSYKIEEIQAAASAFVQQLLPHDKVMVIEFDSSVHVLTEPTGDRDQIYRAIRKTGFGNGTALYEAVEFSIRKRLGKIEGRKAIVLFTDGVDTTSSGASYMSTLQDAEESEAVIYPIYYNTFLQNMGIGGGNGPMTTSPTLGIPGTIGIGQTKRISEAYANGRTYLTQLAQVTGGKLFRAEATPRGLSTAFESIAEELRRQYVLGYYPQSTGSPGDRKAIRIRVNRPKLIIRSRDSYVVGSK